MAPATIGGAPIPVVLADMSGTLVSEGVAALPWKGSPGLLVIEARFADAARSTGPDIEIIRCEKVEPAAVLQPETVSKPTRGVTGSPPRGAAGSVTETVVVRPVRLDRSYDRGTATPGEAGRSRAALTIVDSGDYVVLIGGAPAGTAATVALEQPAADRPRAAPLALPLTRGSIDSASARQFASLRPYALYELKIDAERSMLFSGTATAPVFLEVGDTSDDAAFDWFGLRRSAGATGREGVVERLMLWRTQIVPGTTAVFGLNMKPGTYYVRVRGRTPASLGDYSISVTTPSAADLRRIQEPEPIRIGTTRGTLRVGESFSQDESGAPQFRPVRLYQLTAKAGTGYEVWLESTDKAFDVFLGAGSMVPLLLTPNGTSQRTADGSKYVPLLANNDHPNVDRMTNPTDSCLFFKPQKNGPVVFKALGGRINQSGDFVLTVREATKGCQPAKRAAP